MILRVVHPHKPDFTFSCTGGTIGTANKADLVISAGTITLGGAVKPPTSYSSDGYLGYMKVVSASTNFTIAVNDTKSIHSIDVGQGVWLVFWLCYLSS